MTLIPNFDTGSLIAPAKSTQAPAPNEVALRRAAAQFEALLLTQLTASLNPKEEEGEEGLFSNSGGGMGIASKMYSEQLAKTMSESGGIGIADMLVAQVLKRNGQTLKNQLNPANERALSAARGIKNETISNADTEIGLGSSKTTNLSPAATDIAARYSNPSMEKSNTTGSDPIGFDPNRTAPGQPPVWGAGSAIAATRPRRVHAVEGNATVLNESAAVAKPGLRAAASTRHARVAVPYVSLQSPLHGEIRSKFGMRRDPINGRMRLHQGIDIPAKRGTPIEAAAAGTVVFAGRNKGYGNMVMIEHADGRRTLYAHAQSLFVKVGDTVAAGESIAAVGSTGHSTGPHLHFEVREANRAVNPLSALSNEFAFARR
jgi:murein DD-endopeptidase MepM/ murein hydrolase activator NlpD